MVRYFKGIKLSKIEEVADAIETEIGNRSFKTFRSTELDLLNINDVYWFDLNHVLARKNIIFLPNLCDIDWTKNGQGIRAYRTNTRAFKLALAVINPSDYSDQILAETISKIKGQYEERPKQTTTEKTAEVTSETETAA
jgi:hypothetical protein